MLYLDFGPALTTLSNHAPNLRSLAIHGLRFADEPLLELAEGCRSLRRLNIVRCSGYTAEGMGAFLCAAHGLVRLDLSGSDAPTAEVVGWVDERRRTRQKHVQHLVLIDCVSAEAIWKDLHAQYGQEPDYSGPILSIAGGRLNLFDAVYTDADVMEDALDPHDY
eukprot:5488911-Prymnesium_polylepis.1